MKSIELFIAGIKSERWRWATWRVSIFAVSRRPPKDIPEPYDIDYRDDATYVYNTDGEWEPISGVQPMVPLLSYKSSAVFPGGLCANMPNELETTFGRVIFNTVVLSHSFGNRVPFTSSNDIMEITREVTKLVKPKGEGDVSLNIYPAQLQVYVQMLHELVNLCPVISPTGTERSLQTHPDMKELRTKLYEENKDNLDDPTVVVKIEKELIALDTEYMSKDESIDFYLSSKDYSVKRKKVYLTSGIETGFREDGGHTIIQQPLSEGMDLDNFVAVVNGIREGSDDRGSGTALGGEKVIYLQRMMQSVIVTKGDCGTKVLDHVLINKYNRYIYVGLNSFNGKSIVPITNELADSSIGKVLKIRRPILCTREAPEYCEVCAGEAISRNPRALPSEVVAMVSAIMYVFMQGMHGKELTTSEYEIDMIM